MFKYYRRNPLDHPVASRTITVKFFVGALFLDSSLSKQDPGINKQRHALRRVKKEEEAEAKRDESRFTISKRRA